MNQRPADFARHQACDPRHTVINVSRARCTTCGMTWIMAAQGWQLIGRTSR